MSQEVEAKFILTGLASFRDRLLELGGQVQHQRHLERNWRFDTPQGSFSESGKVLRVRQADQATVTYKEGGADPLVRTELELEVSDAEKANRLFELLGYQAFAIYEKYREVFQFKDAEVMLDELPFGTFVEVEGASPQQVQSICEELGLSWQHRIAASYLEIFQLVRDSLQLNLTDATFDEFEAVGSLEPADLDLSNGWLDEGREMGAP